MLKKWLAYMVIKDAIFISDGDVYYPANSHAVAACAIMSKMKLNKDDILAIKSKGYKTRHTNGDEIGKVDYTI